MSRTMSTQAEELEPDNVYRVFNKVRGLNVIFSFKEEALGMPVHLGLGWRDCQFGEAIGSGGRYAIVRKLGWGAHSTTWLAHDNQFVHFAASSRPLVDIHEL